MLSKNKKRIYLDCAGATALDERVKSEMLPYLENRYGNPSSPHKEGTQAKMAIEEAREKVASFLGAKSDEIIFTSGGTEANNLAIFGLKKDKSKKIAFGGIEHPSVYSPFLKLEKEGFRIKELGINEDGEVDVNDIDDDIGFVSVMTANNEIGTLQPIKKIAEMIKKFDNPPIFHTDLGQYPLFYDANVGGLGVDMASLDGQKLYGPKGIGAFFVKNGVEIEPIIYGGGQELGKRGGTENVAGIVGIGKSCEIISSERKSYFNKTRKLQKSFIEKVLGNFDNAILNGPSDLEKRLVNNINFSFVGFESEYLVSALDNEGIACASKSACLGKGVEGSIVVKKLEDKGGDAGRANSAVRFSLCRETTEKDIDFVIEKLKKILNY